MSDHDQTVRMTIGRDELVIEDRYQTLAILNEILLGAMFLVGSVLFLGQSTKTGGIVLFIVGSVLMLVRPTIHLARRVHLKDDSGRDGRRAHQQG